MKERLRSQQKTESVLRSLKRVLFHHHPQSPTAPVIHQQPQSALFRLPGELRHTIYEMTFALRERTVGSMIELTEADSLSDPALLLVCRALHNEAIDAFHRCRRTWKTATFCITNPYDQGLLQRLEALPSTRQAGWASARSGTAIPVYNSYSRS